MKPPKQLPDIDEAAKHLLIGMIIDGQPKSVTLSNDTIFEYWPPKEGKKQHILNLKIFGRNRGLGTRQGAIAKNAVQAAVVFFGGDGQFTDFGSVGKIYDEWKSHSFGWELPV
jgi:hypothetical protein